MENNLVYTVENATKETENVVTLTLTSETELPNFRAGQFITVFFPETVHAEGKSYSISKVVGKNIFEITVKGIGEFSNRLIKMKTGDKVTASLPYGYFYSESTTSPLVMIAGGIGIAPFRATLVESLELYPERELVIFYSSKTVPDIIFRKEFDELLKNGKSKIKYHVTNGGAGGEVKKGRIPVEDIIEVSKNLKDAEFFICGSIPFVRDFWKGLKQGGIEEERLYTEAFF